MAEKVNEALSIPSFSFFERGLEGIKTLSPEKITIDEETPWLAFALRAAFTYGKEEDIERIITHNNEIIMSF